MQRRSFLKATASGLVAGGMAAAAPFTLRHAAAQDRSGVLVWGGNLSSGLDPHAVYDVPSAFTRANLYDSLYEYSGAPPSAVPTLVESYTVSNDSRTFEFTLRDDVMFHDGTVLEADDVVYSFQRVLALSKGPASTFSPVLTSESITAVDPRTVRFELIETFAPFLSALPMVAILNKELVEANTVDGDWGEVWLSSNDAGSGPYQVVEGSFVPLDRLDLKRFPGYFRGFSSPNPIEEVRVRPVKDDATRIFAVLSGDIDTTYGYIRAEDHSRIEEAENVRLSREPAFRTFLLRMHNGRPPTNNVHFRRAISWAFPYDMFIDLLLLGAVTRNPGPIPASLWGSPTDLEGYSHNMEKAAEELELAKADGVDITAPFTFLALVGFDETEQAAQMLQSELRKLGVTMTIEKALWANASASTNALETSPQIWAHWGSSYLIDPDNWIGQFYSRAALGSQRGSSWYDDAEVQDMIANARSVLDQSQREAIYEEISRAMVDQAVDVWIYNSQTFRAINTRVQGYKPAAVGDAVALREMWLEG